MSNFAKRITKTVIAVNDNTMVIIKPFFISILQINLDYEVGRQSYMIYQFLKLSTFKNAHINRVSAVTDATGTVMYCDLN